MFQSEALRLTGHGMIRFEKRRSKARCQTGEFVFAYEAAFARFGDRLMYDIEPARFGNVFDRAGDAHDGNAMLPAAIAFGNSDEVQPDPRWRSSADSRVLGRGCHVDDTRVELREIIELERRIVRDQGVVEIAVDLRPENGFLVLSDMTTRLTSMASQSGDCCFVYQDNRDKRDKLVENCKAPFQGSLPK